MSWQHFVLSNLVIDISDVSQQFRKVLCCAHWQWCLRIEGVIFLWRARKMAAMSTDCFGQNNNLSWTDICLREDNMRLNDKTKWRFSFSPQRRRKPSLFEVSLRLCENTKWFIPGLYCHILFPPPHLLWVISHNNGCTGYCGFYTVSEPRKQPHRWKILITSVSPLHPWCRARVPSASGKIPVEIRLLVSPAERGSESTSCFKV